MYSSGGSRGPQVRQRRQRSFDKLLLERQTTLEALTAHISQLPELRENLANTERRLLFLLDGELSAFRKLSKKLIGEAPNASPMVLRLTPLDGVSLGPEELTAIRKLDTEIWAVHSQTKIVSGSEIRLQQLEEQIKLLSWFTPSEWVNRPSLWRSGSFLGAIAGSPPAPRSCRSPKREREIPF